jgi:hypothetical protein
MGIFTARVGTAALGCPAERSSAEVAKHTLPRPDKIPACVVAGLCPAWTGRSPVTTRLQLSLHGSCS